MNRAEYLWDWIKHEENQFTTRANFFLVVESVLFAGLTRYTGTNPVLPWFFCGMGFFLALIWMQVNGKHWDETWLPLQAALRELKASDDRPTAEIARQFDDIKNLRQGTRNAEVIGKDVPKVIIVLWIVVAVWILCTTK